jgi:ATP-dependent DNA helicase RecQ
VLSAEVDSTAVSVAEDVLHRPGVPFEPRKIWPTAMPALGIEVRGKVPVAEQADPGRAVARLTDLGFGTRLRSLLAPDAPDAPLPDDVLRACVQVLAAWDWAERPAAVAHVGSARRPRLVADLASRLAGIGRLVDLGELPHRAGSSTGRTNSALRLREVWNAYAVPDDVARQLRGQPVLLVDDLTDTGWTFAVVARLLRLAGAGAVHPFALALAG